MKRAIFNPNKRQEQIIFLLHKERTLSELVEAFVLYGTRVNTGTIWRDLRLLTKHHYILRKEYPASGYGSTIKYIAK